MSVARAQRYLWQTVAPTAGESVTAPMLRIWGLFAALRGDLASPQSPQMEPPHPHPLGNSQPNSEQETQPPQVHLRPKSPLHLQGVMRSPLSATQLRPVGPAVHHSSKAMRSKSCDEIMAIKGPASRAAQLCHKGTSYRPAWLTVHPTGRDRRQRGPVHKQ